MLKINDSVEFSRASAAVSLVLGALCFLAASLVEPAWAPDQRAYLAEFAAAANRYQASGALNALGPAATVFGLIGVLHLLRGRRVTLGQLPSSRQHGPRRSRGAARLGSRGLARVREVRPGRCPGRPGAALPWAPSAR